MRWCAVKFSFYSIFTVISLIFSPIHIAAVQGDVSAVKKLLGIMKKLHCSADVYNKLRQVS